ncbi:hypothetical protein K8R66_04145 [bacterium]|nr:hypothetical protein [bacterium]
MKGKYLSLVWLMMVLVGLLIVFLVKQITIIANEKVLDEIRELQKKNVHFQWAMHTANIDPVEEINLDWNQETVEVAENTLLKKGDPVIINFNEERILDLFTIQIMISDESVEREYFFRDDHFFREGSSVFVNDEKTKLFVRCLGGNSISFSYPAPVGGDTFLKSPTGQIKIHLQSEDDLIVEKITVKAVGHESSSFRTVSPSN